MVLEKMGKYTGITYTSTATAEFDLQRGSKARIQDQVKSASSLTIQCCVMF